MKSDMIYEELIQLDLDVENQEQFFEAVYKILLEKGFVKESFLQAIKEREKNYPTCLNIEPYPIAIPHVDPENIIKPFIFPVRLKNPIKWCEIATSDSWHNVKFIFVLGFLKSNEHIILLQTLLENCQKEETMEKLLNADNAKDYANVILDMKEVSI